jgi:hypothetical protein
MSRPRGTISRVAITLYLLTFGSLPRELATPEVGTSRALVLAKPACARFWSLFSTFFAEI